MINFVGILLGKHYSRYIVLLAALGILSTIPVESFGEEFETPIAITGVTAIPEPGTSIENATIVVESGRIVGVGANVSVPKDAYIIDGTGLWAYAGFIDGGSHVGVSKSSPDEAEQTRLLDDEQDVGQGPRTAMQSANRRGVWPHLGVADFYERDTKKLEAYRKAGLTTALVLPQPAIFSGSGSLVQLSGVPLRRSVVDADIVQLMTYRAPSVAGSRGYPSSAMGAVALMRQTFMDGKWYRQQHAQARSNPTRVSRVALDPVLEAMGAIMDGDQLFMFRADTPSEIHHAMDLAEEFDQELIILGGREAWRLADLLAKEKIPVVAALDWSKKPKLAPKKAKESKGEEEPVNTTYSTRSWNAAWEDDFYEPLAIRRARIQAWEEQVNNVRVLKEAGVAVAVTSRELSGPSDLLKKLREAIKEGLDAEDALEILTTGPAEIYGASEQVGRLAKGSLANITLLTKPFEDKKSSTRYVLIDGEVFEMDVKPESKKKDKGDKSGDDDSDDESEDSDAEDEDEDDDDADSDDAEDDEEEEEPADDHSWPIETESDRMPTFVTNGNVLLRNATVLTVTGETMAETDVLVRDGKIRRIGQGLSASRDTKVIDLTGYWLMPGIVDPHSHIAIRTFNEGSQSITAEVRMSDVVNSEAIEIHRGLAGGVTTIHAMHGSANTIGGQNVVLKMRYRTSPEEMIVSTGPRLVKFALGENVTSRGNRRGGGQRFPNSRMGVESVLRQAFNDAQQYGEEWDAYRSRGRRVMDIPRKDLRLDALSDILDGNIWVHSHGYRADELMGLLAVAEEYDFRVACLQHVLDGYRIMPEMLRHGVGGSTFADFWAYKIEAYTAIPHNAAMMMKAGIVSSLNSDSKEVMTYLNLEAAKSMRFGGLTADEAIRLITINPAIQLGLEDRFGSIEVGKDGDFAVFTNHPLSTFTRCVLTLVEGDVYFQHRDFDPASPTAGPGNSNVPEPPRSPLDIPNADSDVYVIARGTVHTMAGETISNGMVIIRGNKIEAVGQNIQVPTGATIIDATGLQVYPGLVNAATDIGLSEINAIPVTMDSREGARFQPDIRAVAGVNPHSAHIRIARSEGVTTVVTLPSGGTISGRAGVLQLDGWTMPEMLRDDAIGLVISLPSVAANLDSKKKSERIGAHRKSLESLETYMERALHYARVMGAKDASKDMHRDVQLDAMIPYVNGTKPVFFKADSYKQILEALNFAKTFALRPIILGGRDAWKCTDELLEDDVPVIITNVLVYPANEYERHDVGFANPARLEEAGVRFCIASNGDLLTKNLRVDAGISVAYGLSEEGAMRSITLSAAEILGMGDEIGSLEAGKIADVIISTGNPCQVHTRIVASFIAGKPVDLSNLHEESYVRFTNRPEPTLPDEKELAGPPAMRVAE